MAHSSQFEPTIQAVATTATSPNSGQPAAKLAPAPKQRFQPHTKPQSIISSWAWAIFMTSATLFLGSAVFASFTKTAAIPQLPVNFPSVLSDGNNLSK